MNLEKVGRGLRSVARAIVFASVVIAWSLGNAVSNHGMYVERGLKAHAERMAPSREAPAVARGKGW